MILHSSICLLSPWNHIESVLPSLLASCLPFCTNLNSGCHLCRRKEPIIAIGGGVCLDVCGLAANLYRRNTPVIKVPPSLIAPLKLHSPTLCCNGPHLSATS